MKADKNALLAELGLTEAEAAAPVVVDPPLTAAVKSGKVVPDEVHVEPVVPMRTGIAPIIPVKDLPITAATFAGVPMATPVEFDAAYRKVFDAYKVHRKIAPGYNGELTGKIRAAMKAAQPKVDKPDGYVKTKAKAARG